jgi:HEAT repeat protein
LGIGDIVVYVEEFTMNFILIFLVLAVIAVFILYVIQKQKNERLTKKLQRTRQALEESESLYQQEQDPIADSEEIESQEALEFVPPAEEIVPPTQALEDLIPSFEAEVQEVAPVSEIAPAVFPEPIPPSLSQPAIPEKIALDEQIIALGNANRPLAIPQLIQYAAHPDSKIRQLGASALGNIVGGKAIRAEMKPAISCLGKLTQDVDPSVRQAAVAALAKVKSAQVIPFLKRCLRDADSNVVKTASAAISQFKGHAASHKQPTKTAPKKNKLIRN